MKMTTRQIALVLMGLAAAFAGCGEQEGEAPGGLDLRFLVRAQGGAPVGLSCDASARGGGLNGNTGALDIGALRLQVVDPLGATVFDKTVEVVGQKETLRFGGVPVGGGYDIGVTACQTVEGDAAWVGQDRGVNVGEASDTERAILLMPSEGFACASTQPEGPLAFAAAFTPNGEDVLIAGGLTTWTGQGQAQASASIKRFDLETGDFEVLEAVLPSPMAMAASVKARPAPGAPEAMVLVGGVSAIVEGAGSQHVDLLPFGPAPEVAVGRAVWVIDGPEVEVVSEMWPLTPRFASGIGATEIDGVGIVVVVGGITYAELGARVSDTAEIVRLEADGPVSIPVQLQAQRVGAAVVVLEPGLLAIIGGNVGDDAALAELIDLRAEVPTSIPLTISPVVGLVEEVVALARPSAFPRVFLTTSGTSVVVVGGLPVFPDADPGMRPVAPAAIEPVLYRLTFTEAATTGLAILDSPPLYGAEAIRALSQRAFPTAILGARDEAWLMGGVSPEVASPFVPRDDALRIDLETGDVSLLQEIPYRAVGALSVGLWDGSSLIVGGVVDVGQNQLDTTPTAVLRRGHKAPPSCRQEEPDGG